MEETMRRRLLRRPNSAASVAIIPDELMLEILSSLPVKPLIRFRCVNKFFNTLVFDPHFVQMHLNKSSQNSQLALTYYEVEGYKSSLVTLSIPGLLQKQFTTFHRSDPYHLLNDYYYLCNPQQRVVGSCNGLLLIVISCPYRDEWISFWNPAMRTKSENFKICPDSTLRSRSHYKFSFGYDILTQTYKVIAFYFYVQERKRGCKSKCVVKVFSLGDNSWRDIQCPPVSPLDYHRDNNNNNCGVHLNGTINWLARKDLIVSLDLSTETYTQLLLPRIFDCLPKLVVLNKCLCFCLDVEKTHFVIWKMKDFGVQDSWIQLFKISYENFTKVKLLPLYLCVDDDILILANDGNNKAFIYYCRDNKVEEIGITNVIMWFQAKNYVESLVLTH
ncbi:hypothetical protein TSUD_259750 [Trifolium subterraneum]|uniref:F-box domain-containing protein n=1 Tax=Trifolium subterraneum TaxID=3900 RepID=A0A2Z6M0F3_TRISU|nr:hypothetical protein TSUD_259750 [Trifolium subterraneum]